MACSGVAMFQHLFACLALLGGLRSVGIGCPHGACSLPLLFPDSNCSGVFFTGNSRVVLASQCSARLFLLIVASWGSNIAGDRSRLGSLLPGLPGTVMAHASASVAIVVGTSSTSETESVVTVLDSDVAEEEGVVAAVEVGSDVLAVSDESDFEASGPWAAEWVSVCPDGFLTCPHCMTIVPQLRVCEYCLGDLASVSNDEDVEDAEEVVVAGSSSAPTDVPGSDVTELDSSDSGGEDA